MHLRSAGELVLQSKCEEIKLATIILGGKEVDKTRDNRRDQRETVLLRGSNSWDQYHVGFTQNG